MNGCLRMNTYYNLSYTKIYEVYTINYLLMSIQKLSNVNIIINIFI
jgi:hypothetical protein